MQDVPPERVSKDPAVPGSGDRPPHAPAPAASAAAVAEALPPSPAPAPPPPLLAWPSPGPALEASTAPAGWDAVWALEDQQRRRLLRIWERGVAWKPSPPGGEEAAPAPAPVVFRLDHGGEVDADGNCLFTTARMGATARANA